MSHHKKFSWMIRPKGFISLLGGEYDLMQKAGGSVLFKFYLSAITIVFIACISFVSVQYAVKLLFHSFLAEILLSLFLSSLFVLLFIFIVNTFTKDARRRKLFNPSNVTRLGFVMFLGFIISKPIEAFLFRDAIQGSVERHKAELIKDHDEKIAKLFAPDLVKLSNEKARYENLNAAGGFKAEISRIDQQVSLIDQKKKDLAAVSTFRIEQGAYFIYRIKVISWKYPGAWVISFFVIVLFLLPVGLVYSLSSDEEYFKRKHVQEKKMVEAAYNAFTQKYTEIFLAKYALPLEFYSKYEDPPFNTVLKKPPVCRSANDFHERFAHTR